VQTGEVTADGNGSLSVSYTSQNESAASNLWTVDLADAGDTTQILDGDQTYVTFTAPGDIQRDGRIVVNAGETAYVIGTDGNLVPGAGVAVVDNTLYGSDANDRINGLTGNDALDGGAGNDQLFGGEGDDLLAGEPATTGSTGARATISSWVAAIWVAGFSRSVPAKPGKPRSANSSMAVARPGACTGTATS